MHLKSLHDNTVKRLADLTLKRLYSILEMTTRCISPAARGSRSCSSPAAHGIARPGGRAAYGIPPLEMPLPAVRPCSPRRRPPWMWMGAALWPTDGEEGDGGNRGAALRPAYGEEAQRCKALPHPRFNWRDVGRRQTNHSAGTDEGKRRRG